MLRKIVTAIIIIPLAVILVGFAVANRQSVTVSFDPFSATAPAYALTLPLFGIVFVILITGVIVGGVAAWLRQSHWRRSARRLDAETRALRGEVEALRTQVSAQSSMPVAAREMPPSPDRAPPLIPPPPVP
jgi:uncharacterized integral membrane protein